jgi:hypothetical protein
LTKEQIEKEVLSAEELKKYLTVMLPKRSSSSGKDCERGRVKNIKKGCFLGIFDKKLVFKGFLGLPIIGSAYTMIGSTRKMSEYAQNDCECTQSDWKCAQNDCEHAQNDRKRAQNGWKYTQNVWKHTQNIW